MADSTCVLCSLLNDATLARPTYTSHVAGGPVDLPPLTHWELITVHWTYSGYRLPTQAAQATSRWLRVSTVVKTVVKRSLVQLFIALLDSEKFNAQYREIFSSLESR